MSNKNKGKVIVYNFKKDLDDTKTTESSKENIVLDLRKNYIEKMVNDLASLNDKHEDLLEG